MTATRQMWFWLGALVVAGLLIWILSDMLMPFAAGMAIAYLLDPLADRLERIGVPRWLATTLVLFAFFVLVSLLLVLIVPLIQQQISSFAKAYPDFRETFEEWLGPLIERLPEELGQPVGDLPTALAQYAGTAFEWALSMLGGLWRGGMALINVVSLLVITPVVAFYLLRDWDRMVAKIDNYLPREYAPTIRDLAAKADDTLAGFVRGQGTVCIILGVFYAVSLTLVGLDFGLLVGLMAGILTFIPYVGTITGFIASMGIALVQFDSWQMWALVAGIFIFGQVVEGNFLTPKLVGSSIGLHPVMVIFALLAGGTLFGFTGVLLAMPAAAVIGVLVRFFLGRYQESGYYRGPSTSPSTPAQPPKPGWERRP